MAVAATGMSVINMNAYDPEMIGSIFTRVDLLWPKDARAEFVVSPLGDLSLIRSTHVARNSRSRRLERHMTEKEEGYFFACTPLEGSMEIRRLRRDVSQGRTCNLKSGNLAILNTNEEYEIGMSEALDAIWLRVPAKLLRSHAISIDDVLGVPLDVRGGLGLVAKQMMQGAVVERNHLTDRSARIFSHSILSFLGEVVNSNLSSDKHLSSRGRRKILERAQKFIDENIYEDELNPLQIAQGIGISSRYLSEIFAAEGTSPMRWVRKRRLELCRMELERQNGRDQLICEIAYSMGFANVSSFNRAFKTQFGHSPRDLLAQKTPGARKTN